MSELPSNITEAAEYLHSRSDLHIVGPFSFVDLAPDKRDQWHILIAPRTKLALPILNELEEDLASKLNPTDFVKTREGGGITIALGKLRYSERRTIMGFSGERTTNEVIGEVTIFPNFDLLNLEVFSKAAAGLKRTMATYYDSTYFGVPRVQNPETKLHMERVMSVDFLMLKGVSDSLFENVFNGNIHPFEIRAMIANLLQANARSTNNPDAFRRVDQLVRTHR